MSAPHHTPYLSPSRLTAYADCPAEYARRYIRKEWTPAMEPAWGTAVHKGVELAFNGQDGEMGFLFEWKRQIKELQAIGITVDPALTQRGMEAVQSVLRLGLQGEPEKSFIYPHPGFIIPFKGIVDLWDSPGNRVLDFKTSGRPWTQSRVDKQLFQPAIYSQAFRLEHGTLPRFEFVIIPRNGGPIQRLDATRTEDQQAAIFEQAELIHQGIEAQDFLCRCKRHMEVAA